MPNIASGAQTFDSLAAKLQVIDALVKTSNLNAPILTDYMSPVGELGSRTEWFDQALPTGKVVLASAYTAGSGTIVLSAPTIINNYTIKPGITQLQTTGSTPLIFTVNAWNSATNTATVTVTSGSDANIASGSNLYLTRSNAMGSSFDVISDTYYATSDFNYLENFFHQIIIANPQKEGRITTHVNENTFANQLENLMPEIIRTLEVKALKNSRGAGTGGATRNGNIIQSGNGSTSGGILAAMQARSGYVTASSAPISEDLLETDMIQLRNRGAFTTIDKRVREFGLGVCNAYCSEATFGDVNKLVRLERAPDAFFALSEKKGGLAGTFATAYIANGVIVNFKISQAIEDNEILYIPQRAEKLINVDVLRMAEEQPALANGDNEIRMYATTWLTRVACPWLLGYRSGLVRL